MLKHPAGRGCRGRHSVTGRAALQLGGSVGCHGLWAWPCLTSPGPGTCGTQRGCRRAPGPGVPLPVCSVPWDTQLPLCVKQVRGRDSPRPPCERPDRHRPPTPSPMIVNVLQQGGDTGDTGDRGVPPEAHTAAEGTRVCGHRVTRQGDPQSSGAVPGAATVPVSVSGQDTPRRGCGTGSSRAASV